LKKLILSFAAVAAILGAIGLSGGSTPASAGLYDLRADMACSPLTNSQLVQEGDSQRCRIRIRNFSQYDITNVTFVRDTPNTLTNRFIYSAWETTPFTCDLSGCTPFDIGKYGSVIIVEDSTFNASEDGRGLTKVEATGTMVVERVGKPTLYIPVSGGGTEQKSLP